MKYWLAVALIAGGCASARTDTALKPLKPPTTSPYVLVLGTAQDAGLPQIGSTSRQSELARRDPRRVRLVASLLIAHPKTGKRWLIDATPDIRAQVERAVGHPATRKLPGSRPPLFDGVFLTHAHMGHYSGLVHFGREAYGAKKLPVHGSEKMCAFLAGNGPWDLLVKANHVVLRKLQPGVAVTLAQDLKIVPLLVPHRAEYTDTLGFIVHGPNRSLLYIPDIDKWERWSTRIEDVLAKVDVALLDGTFFADGEIPGRSMKDIPHPFIAESIARFSSLPASERKKVVLTHLNHTNDAADPAGEAAQAVRKAGMAVAEEGRRYDL